MKFKLFLICLANTVLIAFSSYKDEASLKWPFCNFKEGNYDDLYRHLQLYRKPKSPLYCHIPVYLWGTDSPPNFADISEEVAFLLDIDGERVHALATFWSNGDVQPHCAVWGTVLDTVQNIDISKYSIGYFDNSYSGMEGFFFKARHSEDENLVYVFTSEFDAKIETDVFMTEKNFIALWEERVKGQIDFRCADMSDSDFVYQIEL